MIKLKEIMSSGNETMGRYYNEKRKDITFSVGEWVMLKTDHIRSKRTCKKLSEKQIGPFKIIKKITNQTYQLDLKNLVGKIHDVFHVDKLEIATTPQEGQYDYEREWFFNDEEVFKTFKNIANSRFRNGIFEYEVSWSDGTKNWIAREELDDDIEINAFHNRNPNKPIP
ncbi:hypothetical protein K3495_g17387, partial [Podosphaera aphanis]